MLGFGREVRRPVPVGDDSDVKVWMAGEGSDRTYDVYPNTREMRAIIDAIRHWSRLEELAQFATERHGFGDSDGGFGVNYPDDLDEYDRSQPGGDLPYGSVDVYGFWGPPDGYEFRVPETTYLSVLAKVLMANNLANATARVDALLAALKATGGS